MEKLSSTDWCIAKHRRRFAHKLTPICQLLVLLSALLVTGAVLAQASVHTLDGHSDDKASVRSLIKDSSAGQPFYSLDVNSTGSTGVEIFSNSGHGGITDYVKTDILSGTSVSLTASLASGDQFFNGWIGCDSTGGLGGSGCSVNMSSDKIVTAEYVDVYDLDVNSTGVTGVLISSSSGHGGTTDYTLTLGNNTFIILTAPLNSGYKIFNGWTGCDSTSGASDSICNVTLSGDKTVEVDYLNPADVFVTTWQTNPHTFIRLPMVGGPYEVDWNNDGVFEEGGLNDAVIHDFGIEGDFTISVRGTYDGIRSAGEKIISLDQWGTQQWSAMFRAFSGAINLKINATDVPDFSSVTDMASMFSGATSANPDTSNWDTSSVTDMSSMFSGATSANPDTSNWDTSSVTDMSRMFRGATSANPDTSNWDTSSVSNMSFMFDQASSATPNTSSWDTSSVTDMSFMFFDATSADPDTSNWDTSSVTTMSNIFWGATSANPDTSSWDTSSVTTMSGMFNGATSANPDTSNWDTSSVTDMSNIFWGATSADPDTRSWDTSSVTDVFSMFSDSSANPDTSDWDISSVTTMAFMFSGATSANPDTSGWDTSSVTDMSSVFRGATSANPNTSGWDTSSVSNMSFMFDHASSANPDTSGWDVTNLRVASSMFLGSGLSIANYDSLLISWSAQILQPDVPFSAGLTRFCSPAAVLAKLNILETYSWLITDGGQGCEVIFDNGFE